MAFRLAVGKIGSAAVFAGHFGSVSAVVVISGFAFGRTVFPVFGTAVRRADFGTIVTVVGF